MTTLNAREDVEKPDHSYGNGGNKMVHSLEKEYSSFLQNMGLPKTQHLHSWAFTLEN